MRDGASGDADAMAVLALLAQEAPRESFEDLLRGARGKPSISSERLAALEQAVHLGLTVNASADQRRRREVAMAALVDTARDMTSPYDLDSLLSVITRRARRLLGFDMAYISLNRPEGGSYVHSSDGETTMFNVGLQIDTGHGLGENAQDKRAPLWTADYLNDSGFPHSDRIDEVVRAEGLRAIMAVPMSHGTSTVGALYGADRKLRHFTPDEVSLMRSLADLAAVALEKARLLDRIRTELSELERRSTTERTTTARIRALAEARDGLAEMVLDGTDLREVCRATGEALDGTVFVHDPFGQPLGGMDEFPDLDEESVAKASLAALAASAPVAMSDTFWAAPAVAAADKLGVLLVQTRTPLGEAESDFLVYAGRAAALVLLLQRSAAVAAGPVRDELFDALLVSRLRSPRQLAERARRLGVDPCSAHSVVVVHPEGGEQGQAMVWASLYAQRRSGLRTVHGGRIALLLPGEDPAATARAVHRELSTLLSRPVSVAAAGPARELAAIREVYQEAERSLEALICLGGKGGVATTEDLGFLGLLLSDDLDVDRYVDSTLGPVLSYDVQRDAGLIRTLEAYFASQSSPTRAAGLLFVHPNTVSRRLERLTELLGEDWQDPSRALEIQLALRLLRTRGLVRRKREDSAAHPADRVGSLDGRR